MATKGYINKTIIKAIKFYLTHHKAGTKTWRSALDM